MDQAATRAANLDTIERELHEGTVEVKSVPHEVIFSAEHRCNLRCVMCASTVERNQGHIPLMDIKLPQDTLARFRKLEPIAPYWTFASLTGSGEPMLSPALPAMLEILGLHGVPATFNTHGNLIDREEAEMMVRTRLHGIVISVDASCRETYERIRVNGKWDKLIHGIDTLVQVRRESQSQLPKIVLSGNFMRQNIEELPGLVELAAAHGADRVLAVNTVVYDPAMQDQALVYHRELARKMVLEAIERARSLGIEFDNRIDDLAAAPGGEANDVQDPPPVAPTSQACEPPAKRRRSSILEACQAPWRGLMVESEGSVKVCCFNSPYVGNLNRQSFEEIWNGEPLKELRRSFVADLPPEGCRTCFIFMHHQKQENQFVKLIPTAESGD